MGETKLIFFSYAEPDRERVSEFYNYLTSLGFAVWMDTQNLKGGQNWDFEIKRAIKEATIVVVFLSNYSVDRRGYAQREIRFALDVAKDKLIDDIYIIPVLLDKETTRLLKVAGKYISDFDDREGLSAILCLNTPIYKPTEYDYQNPVFFRREAQGQLDKAATCRDAVQVGPRIIEDPKNKTLRRRGINADEERRNVRASRRVVFAVDDPRRAFPDNKAKDNARDALLIVTQNDVYLSEVQEMLMAPEFYGGGAQPLWAVNMAGGGPSGMVVSKGQGGDPIVIGNPSGVVGSVLVIKARR